MKKNSLVRCSTMTSSLSSRFEELDGAGGLAGEALEFDEFGGS